MAVFLVVAYVRTLLQPFHRLLLQLIDTLNLTGREELGVLLVVLLAQVENLAAALHAGLDDLVGLGIGHLSLLLGGFHLRSQGSHLLLIVAECLDELLRGGVVEGQVVGDVLRLCLGQLLAAHALFITLFVLCLYGGGANGHHDGADCDVKNSLHIHLCWLKCS